MIDLLTSKGQVRQWSLVNGEPRCVLDALDPLHAGAPGAYGRSVYIKGLLERDAAYPPSPPVTAEGEQPDPEWTPPEMDADVALLRRVRAGPQSVANEDGTVHEDETYDDDVQALVALVDAAEPIAPPIPIPDVISDRQFGVGLQRLGLITNEEARAFIKTGDLPPTLAAFVAAIPDEQARFEAEMLISGATTFERSHPLVLATAAGLQWTPEQVAQFWATAARL